MDQSTEAGKSDPRLTSAVLSTYPWESDFILQDFTESITDPMYRTFTQSLVTLEEELTDVAHEEVSDMNRILAKVSADTLAMPPAPRLQRIPAAQLCSLLCAYKLVDVLYALQNPPLPYQNPRYPKCSLKGLRPNSSHWPLANWVRLLGDARQGLTALSKFRGGSIGPNADDGTPLELRLFRDLHSLWNQKSGTKILLNVQMAAFHLSFMLKAQGNKRLSIPNLPEKVHTMLTLPTLTDEEASFLKGISQTQDIAKLRHPLYGALLFSPLYLLLGKALGNQKPELIVSLEHALWKVLLDIATGKMNAFSAMVQYMKDVPWGELEMVETSVADFFNDDENKPGHSNLLSVEGETALEASWPLCNLRPRPADPPAAPVAASGDGDGDVPDDPMDTDDQGPQVAEGSAKVASSSVPKAVASGPAHKKKRNPRQPRKGKKTRSHFVPYQEIGDGLFLQPVRVPGMDFREEGVNFDSKSERTRVRGGPVEIIDITGRPRVWVPEFHHQADLQDFMSFYNRAVDCYHDGRPRYLSDPSTSILRVIPWEKFDQMPVHEVQALLAQSHIVVTDHPTRAISFDEDGLEKLRSLDLVTEIQDQSISPDEDLNQQLRFGTLQQVLEATRRPHGPIANALSLPSPLSAIKRSPISSDIEAWLVTGDQNQLYPTGLMRWSLCSARGARHWTHIDSDGLGTIVDVRSGGKWWFLFSLGGRSHFGSVQDFLHGFDTNTAGAKFHVEAVYLTAGTRLIMRPNTPHAVFSAEHSVATGGHFYSFGNMQDTLSGMIHNCVIDRVITNSSCPEVRFLLFRMVQYVYKCYVTGTDGKKLRATHLPILSEPRGLFEVLSLCNYCILANVLDGRTYSFPKETPLDSRVRIERRIRYDYNALTPTDRHQFMFFRGVALNLIAWLECHYVCGHKNQPNEDLLSIEELAGSFLAQQACGILNYKVRATQGQYEGFSDCGTLDIRRQLELLFADKILGQDTALFSNEKVGQAFVFAFDPSEYVVGEAPEPNEFEEVDHLTLGKTRGDQMFLQGTKEGFPVALAADNDGLADDSDDPDDGDDDDEGVDDEDMVISD